ncbi:MAG: hypothetical protein ACE5GO_08425 [Anaerolineales bacterium]
MRNMTLLVAILGLLAPSMALAQSLSFLAIPSSGFTPQNSTTHFDPPPGSAENRGYEGNSSGTARFFGDNEIMFAPVNLPHGSTVISLTCGGRADRLSRRIVFRLRRNEPQQANVNMALVSTDFNVTSFQTKSTTSITSPVIDNRRFNYYMVATIVANGPPECRTCSVNRCTIAYRLPLPSVGPPVAK